MWFECLPSLCIIMTVMAIPQTSAYVINKLVFGNSYRRTLLMKDNWMQYLRDTRVGGDPYVVNGLEVIPDEDDENC